jgi:tetratricopeptide (TPR) repeat protein
VLSAASVSGPQWRNVYRLSEEQLQRLEEAENLMEMLDINNAESILMELLEGDSDCVPVLNNLGHMYGRYLSEWEKAIEYYERVLQIEPDNAWARDERRRYRRLLTYD